MRYNFEWDIEKAKVNKKKHKLTFEDAISIFKDSMSISIYDDDHSENEDRWATIGITENGVLIVVVHTYNQIDENTVKIRIISSRKATKKEIEQYTRII